MDIEKFKKAMRPKKYLNGNFVVYDKNLTENNSQTITQPDIYQNNLKLLIILKKDLNQSHSKFITIKFFRRNLSSYWIWICILERFYYNNNNNIENIIKEIPSEHASRPTLFKIIDDAVKKNYLARELNKEDKRKFNLLPSEQTIKEFEEWSKIFK